MSDWSEPEISETISLVAANGVAVDAWDVLSRSNRLVLRLLPGGLIVKTVRIEDAARLMREVAVAKHVFAQSGPAVPPATGASLWLGGRVAVSLWEPAHALAPPTDAEVCAAYLDLRRCLDSYAGSVPDFREPVLRVASLLNSGKLRHVTSEDASLLRVVCRSSLTHLAGFRWMPCVLHGDPHAGNVATTRQGLQWLDFESTCTGPVEWDLSALPAGACSWAHDSTLLATLVRLRRVCVVVWCASKACPDPAQRDAIAYHLGMIKAEAVEPGRPLTHHLT